jgi:hypothetical protein
MRQSPLLWASLVHLVCVASALLCNLLLAFFAVRAGEQEGWCWWGLQ